MQFETATYFFLWTVSVIYSVYRFSFTSFKYFRYYKDEYDDFTQGISFLSNKRDKADLEWEAIMFLVTDYFPWMLIYVSVAQAIKYLKYLQIFKLWQILFTIVYILIKWNFMFLALLLIQPVSFYIVRLLYAKKSSIWILTGILLVFLNYLKSIINNPNVLEMFNLKDYELYILVCSLFWMNLKCTSFYLENIQKNSSLDILSYCLYPPTVFSGPFILYKDFESSYSSKNKLCLWKCRKLVKSIIQVLFWFGFLYLCLHFVYVNAAAYHPQLIENLDSWSLYGFGYTMGQFFHLKYVIQYGMSTSLASFEHINVPNLPRCIGRIHLYSDMWKYFDPGLYNFLTRNIYLPMAELTQNKAIRSFLCFLFVYFWHGLESHILIWTVLNYFGIICEDIIWPKDNNKINKQGEKQNWKRRQDCFVAAFLLAMSAISNFYFFAGTDVGNVFFRRILTDMIGNILLIAALFCCCQVSTEIRTIPASKM